MRIIQQIKIIIISFLTCSCSIAPVKPTSTTKYMINYNLNHQNCINNGKESIYIKNTIATPPYNTHNMLYSKSPYTINQYSYSFWANLPQTTILQAIIQEMQNTCQFANVYSGDMTSTTDYILNSQILSIKENIQKNDPTTELAIE
ncbi:MAG: hypothetical protein K2P99_04410, partial [Burkholderiales bacterium]|nr:hypothetical protein [Burkholderiales bacterium]